MAVNDNDSRVKRTKKLIRKGITELAREKSISRITVKELTDLIEINRGTFYLHYKDISDLVKSIEEELYREFSEIIAEVNPKTVLEAPVNILERFCTFVEENSDAFIMLLGEHGDAEFVYKIGAMLADTCQKVFESIYPDMNRERYNLAYEYCKYGAMGLLRCWLVEHPNRTPREMAELWLLLIARGAWGVIDTREN